MMPLSLQPQPLWRKAPVFFFVAAFFSACFVVFFYSRPPSQIVSLPDPELSPSLPPPDEYNPCSVDLDRLRKYSNHSVESVEYARLEIAVTPTDNFTRHADALNTRFPKFRTVRLDTEAHRQDLSPDKCTASVTIQGPMPSARPDASHMIFGLATSLDRLLDSLDAFAHWAAGTNAQLLVAVDNGGGPEKKQAQQRADALGIRLTILQEEDERLDRYFYLIRYLYKHRDANTQWAVMMDDDTFFPSMTRLVDRLATYDTTKPQYVGGVTEDLQHMYGSGYMAYGGAGIFLSMPLLQQLQPYFDECYVFKAGGDRMLSRCIYAHTTTKLSVERDLFQLDLRGDASGFYEAGRGQPLSVHHWKSWFEADMVGLSKVASICGEECLLHRWLLPDEWYLVNGFSVIKYSTVSDDPLPMEHTWDASKYPGPDPFTWSLGPLRRKDENKISFRLRDAVQEEGRVRQMYVHEVAPKKLEVLEVVWNLVP
ncbi:hypothetical protein BO70DRAFT_359949 [Aspergillus heteromorphus CBS 117.55]|uniref:Glycosyltransferase family 31 protein n=1 Tax=Aspergillus heteromorphus CBS 117.55 TaxID=1448321 RepID=A0A317WR11_9EURO|nr:uncharacterized protein BO70DRAFT_359949 [Aspergillus heteromorphus CBS 117.55]PWY88495.1 hypothetical protein BO70DRAFT_359949 [Aspergillus heteromorphus CBS 117.55]